MRLSDDHIRKIVSLGKEIFGDEIKIYLLGSRINDNLKGGDIDLMIESNKHIDKKMKIEFFSNIYKNVTERKIDLIIIDDTSKVNDIYNIAKIEGIVLC